MRVQNPTVVCLIISKTKAWLVERTPRSRLDCWKGSKLVLQNLHYHASACQIVVVNCLLLLCSPPCLPWRPWQLALLRSHAMCPFRRDSLHLTELWEAWRQLGILSVLGMDHSLLHRCWPLQWHLWGLGCTVLIEGHFTVCFLVCSFLNSNRCMMSWLNETQSMQTIASPPQKMSWVCVNWQCLTLPYFRCRLTRKASLVKTVHVLQCKSVCCCFVVYRSGSQHAQHQFKLLLAGRPFWLELWGA